MIPFLCASGISSQVSSTCECHIFLICIFGTMDGALKKIQMYSSWVIITVSAAIWAQSLNYSLIIFWFKTLSPAKVIVHVYPQGGGTPSHFRCFWSIAQYIFFFKLIWQPLFSLLQSSGSLTLTPLPALGAIPPASAVTYPFVLSRH